MIERPQPIVFDAYVLSEEVGPAVSQEYLPAAQGMLPEKTKL